MSFFKKYWLSLAFFVLAIFVLVNNFYLRSSEWELVFKFIFLVLYVGVLGVLKITKTFLFTISVGLICIPLALMIIFWGTVVVMSTEFIENSIFPMIIFVIGVTLGICSSRFGQSIFYNENKVRQGIRRLLFRKDNKNESND